MADYLPKAGEVFEHWWPPESEPGYQPCLWVAKTDFLNPNPSDPSWTNAAVCLDPGYLAGTSPTYSRHVLAHFGRVARRRPWADQRRPEVEAAYALGGAEAAAALLT